LSTWRRDSQSEGQIGCAQRSRDPVDLLLLFLEPLIVEDSITLPGERNPDCF